MPAKPYAVTFDLSCAFDEPRTGVGYSAVDLVTALSQHPDAPEIRCFATKPGHSTAEVPPIPFARQNILPRAGRIKHILWGRDNFPPIEWFTGDCDIAHGLFHLLPAARKAKRVVTIHDLSFIKFPQYHMRDTVEAHTAMVKHAAKHADMIVTVSETVRGEILEAFPTFAADRIAVVPNGVDVDAFAAVPPIEYADDVAISLDVTRGDYLIYIGTLEPRKNIERLIAAFRMAVEETGKPYKLLFVGKLGWNSEGIQAAIAQLQLDDLGCHAGRLPREEAIALLHHARACTYVSEYEGFGMPVIEAMAACTPVVAGDIPVLREVGGDAAIYAEVESEEHIAEQIARVMTDDELCNDLSRRGAERAKDFTWKNSAEHLLAAYAKVL